MKKNWFLKKFEVLNPYFTNFSCGFSFIHKFNWPKFHEFPISHNYRRPRTWSNLGYENEILFLEYLAISFRLPNKISDQPSVRIHLPDVSIVLAHLRKIVGQKWGWSAHESSSQVRYPYELYLEMGHKVRFCPNWVPLVLEDGWFTDLGNHQLRSIVWQG